MLIGASVSKSVNHFHVFLKHADVFVQLLEAMDHIERAVVALFQPLKVGTDPGLSLWRTFPVQFGGQIPEVFLNMMQIHPLLGAFEPIISQIPYPDGPVRENEHRLGSE